MMIKQNNNAALHQIDTDTVRFLLYCVEFC